MSRGAEMTVTQSPMECPFCGGEPMPIIGVGWAIIYCRQCAVEMRDSGLNARDGVWRKWNRRASDDKKVEGR